jgi:Tfp pilus assembly protein PilF
LGLIYLELRQPAKAQDILSAQLLKIDPNSADGHAGLADAFADQHRNLEALEEYKRVAALDSSYQGVNYNMGVMQARLKLYDDAIASLLKQRQIADDADNENLLADVYNEKGMKVKLRRRGRKPSSCRALTRTISVQ